MDESSWIADGTPADEPVTTETPTEVAETPVDEAPAPTTSEQPVTQPEAVEAPVDPTPAEVAQAYIEGKLGDEPYQIPENALLPLKRGDEVEYAPVTELLKRGMMEKDYRLKTAEVSEQRRAIEADRQRFEAERAKMDARAKFLEEQETELKQAMTDPQKWAAYQEHLDQYQKNPAYRAHVDRSLTARETEAELATYREAEDRRIVEQASETAKSWISGLADEFPNVDPNRVAQLYGQRLSAGQARLDASEVRAIYQSEADYLTSSVTPLQSELAALKAQVEKLTASQAAEQHNAQTAHAVNRAKAPRVATGQSAPAKTPVPPKKFGPNELQERNSEWVKAG